MMLWNLDVEIALTNMLLLINWQGMVVGILNFFCIVILMKIDFVNTKIVAIIQ